MEGPPEHPRSSNAHGHRCWRLSLRPIAPVSFSSDHLRSGASDQISDESPCLVDPDRGLQVNRPSFDIIFLCSRPTTRSCRGHFFDVLSGYALVTLSPEGNYSMSPQCHYKTRFRRVIATLRAKLGSAEMAGLDLHSDNIFKYQIPFSKTLTPIPKFSI